MSARIREDWIEHRVQELTDMCHTSIRYGRAIIEKQLDISRTSTVEKSTNSVCESVDRPLKPHTLLLCKCSPHLGGLHERGRIGEDVVHVLAE